MPPYLQWLRLAGSLKLQVSECNLFYKALLQKRPIIWRSLQIFPRFCVTLSQWLVLCICRVARNTNRRFFSPVCCQDHFSKKGAVNESDDVLFNRANHILHLLRYSCRIPGLFFTFFLSKKEPSMKQMMCCFIEWIIYGICCATRAVLLVFFLVFCFNHPFIEQPIHTPFVSAASLGFEMTPFPPPPQKKKEPLIELHDVLFIRVNCIVYLPFCSESEPIFPPVCCLKKQEPSIELDDVQSSEAHS